MPVKEKTDTVPMAVLRKSPLHFDRPYTKQSVEELADSIERTCLMNPITVRKNGRMYEYLAGERRVEALKMLGAKKAKCTIVDCDDLDATILTLEENLKRANLDTKHEKKAIRMLVDAVEQKKKILQRETKPSEKSKPTKIGRPKSTRNEAIEKVAKETGKSSTTIRRITEEPQKLCKAAQTALDRELITVAQADALKKLSKETQEEELSKMIEETNDETTKRKLVEGPKKGKSKDATAGAVKLFGRIVSESHNLNQLVEGFLTNTNRQMFKAIVTMDRDAVIHLQKSLEQLLEAIESVELAHHDP